MSSSKEVVHTHLLGPAIRHERGNALHYERLDLLYANFTQEDSIYCPAYVYVRDIRGSRPVLLGENHDCRV